MYQSMANRVTCGAPPRYGGRKTSCVRATTRNAVRDAVGVISLSVSELFIWSEHEKVEI